MWCKSILQCIGLKNTSAEIISDALLEADLRGKDSHGIARLPIYIERIERGLIEPQGLPQLVTKYGTASIYDGNNGLGHILAYKVMKKCTVEAIKTGVSVAGVRNANHFGMAAYYAEVPTKKKMIGFICCNAAPAMAPFGGTVPVLGSNPLAIAVPTPWGHPLTVDMATTVISRGKIRNLVEGGDIGQFALCKDGFPARNVKEALEGSLLPMGGYKGFGLALMIDIIAGVLTGAMFGKYIGSTRDMTKETGIGFFVGVLNVEALMELSTFYKRLEDICEQVRASNSCLINRQRLPGDKSYKIREHRLKEGIPLKKSLIKKLSILGKRYEHDFEDCVLKD